MEDPDFQSQFERFVRSYAMVTGVLKLHARSREHAVRSPAIIGIKAQTRCGPPSPTCLSADDHRHSCLFSVAAQWAPKGLSSSVILTIPFAPPSPILSAPILALGPDLLP